MMQFTANQLSTKQRSARLSEARYLRTRASHSSRTAADLLDEQGRVTVETQEQALQLSNEAIGLLAQIRGSVSDESALAAD